MRVFLDANILFSACKSAGAIRELLRRLTAAGHTPCIDEYVVAEARRNLEIKAPESLSELDALIERCELSLVQADALADRQVAGLPEKDRPVLAAAIASGCQVLVTGDKTHFGPLYGRIIQGVTIHSPRSLAEVLRL